MGQCHPFGPFLHAFLVYRGNQDHQANLEFLVGQSLHLCPVYLFCHALLRKSLVSFLKLYINWSFLLTDLPRWPRGALKTLLTLFTFGSLEI